MRALQFFPLLIFASAILFSASRVNCQVSSDYAVDVQFTAPAVLFPEEFLKPPQSARATFFDPVHDNTAIERILCVVREELSRYPPAFLKQNLTDVYLVKSLSLIDV